MERDEERSGSCEEECGDERRGMRISKNILFENVADDPIIQVSRGGTFAEFGSVLHLLIGHPTRHVQLEPSSFSRECANSQEKLLSASWCTLVVLVLVRASHTVECTLHFIHP